MNALCICSKATWSQPHLHWGGMAIGRLPPAPVFLPGWCWLPPVLASRPPTRALRLCSLPWVSLLPILALPPSRCSNRLPALFLSFILPLPNFLPLLHWLASLPLPLASLDLLRVPCPSVVSVSVWVSFSDFLPDAWSLAASVSAHLCLSPFISVSLSPCPAQPLGRHPRPREGNWDRLPSQPQGSIVPDPAWPPSIRMGSG